MKLLKTLLVISSIQVVAAFSLSQLKTKPSSSALKAWQDDPYGSVDGSSRSRYYGSGYQRYPSYNRYGYDNYDRGYQRYPSNRYNRGYNDRYNRGYNMGFNSGYENFDGSYQCASLIPEFDQYIRDPWRNRGNSYSSGNYGYGNYGSYGNYGNYNGRYNRGYQLSPSMDYSGYNSRSYLGLENRAYNRYPFYGYSNGGYDRYYNGRQNYLPSYSSYDLNTGGRMQAMQYDGAVVQ